MSKRRTPSNRRQTKRQNSAQNRSTSSRPAIGRTLSLAFGAIALVIFFAVQSGAGNLPTLFGLPETDATRVLTPVVEGDSRGEGDSPSPQADQAAVATATLAPTRAQQASSAATIPADAPTIDAPTPTANAPPAPRASDLPTIAYGELPPEAHDTIRLIDQGGPFPFNKDGATFQNREGLLPARTMGYYSEYTVITPDEDDRGARRIVAGDDGEMYYTADHYRSFREVIR